MEAAPQPLPRWQVRHSSRWLTELPEHACLLALLAFQGPSTTFFMRALILGSEMRRGRAETPAAREDPGPLPGAPFACVADSSSCLADDANKRNADWDSCESRHP